MRDYRLRSGDQRRRMPAVAFRNAARVAALSAVMTISAVQAPRGEGTGTLVYAIHQDSWGSYVLDGLALMHPDGSNQVRLTYSADSEPSWSPDGLRIAFTRSSDIYVLPLTGGALVNLTNNPASDSAPAWSPDGRRIAFTSDRDGAVALYLMNADGTGVVRLTGDVVGGWRPAWAPDGSRIAFNCYIEAGNGDLCTTTVDGSTITRLTNAPGRDSEAAWSPDGSAIAFATERYGTTTTTGDGEEWRVAEIALMNADGSGVRPLRAGMAAEYPSWSPDGMRISADVTLDTSIIRWRQSSTWR